MLYDPFWNPRLGLFHSTSIFDDEQGLRESPSRKNATTLVTTLAEVELIGPIMCESDLSTGLVFQWNTGNNKTILKKVFKIKIKRKIRFQSIPSMYQGLDSKTFHQLQELGGSHKRTEEIVSRSGLTSATFECWVSPKLEQSTGSFRFFKTRDEQIGIAPCGVAEGDVICQDPLKSDSSYVVLRPKRIRDAGLGGLGIFYLVGRALFCNPSYRLGFKYPDYNSSGRWI